MKALITGCPRSGTGYIAKVLGAGHERVFHPSRSEPWTGIEVSWLGAPALPLAVPTAHQLRDPLAVIASLVGIKLFSRPGPFRRFAENVCPEILDEPTATAKAARLWVHWTRLADRADVSWRVEEPDVECVAAFARRTAEDVAAAVASTPRDVNHRTRGVADLDSIPSPLWWELVSRTETYGYEAAR